MRFFGLIAASVLLLGAQSAHAVTILNGDFEASTPTSAGSFSTEGVGSTAIPDWEIESGNVDIVSTYWQQPSGGGTYSLDMTGTVDGTIKQKLTGLVTNQKYTVSFLMAGNPGGPTSVGLNVTVDNAQLDTFNFTPQSTSNMGWAARVYTFVATGPEQYLRFAGLGSSGYGAALDNVSIAATPIPGAVLLFGSALGGLGLLGYRRRKSNAD